jgi:hypothetical protein
VVFHARIATHGRVDTDNCHPFRLEKHPQTAVAHNGIIPAHTVKDSPFSDTKLFCRDVLEGLPPGFLDNKSIRKMLGNYIGYSKLVFLNGAGECTIINSSLGLWFRDRWYSNDSYLPRVPFIVPDKKEAKGLFVDSDDFPVEVKEEKKVFPTKHSTGQANWVKELIQRRTNYEH